jgi:hypothetical protein
LTSDFACTGGELSPIHNSLAIDLMVFHTQPVRSTPTLDLLDIIT